MTLKKENMNFQSWVKLTYFYLTWFWKRFVFRFCLKDKISKNLLLFLPVYYTFWLCCSWTQMHPSVNRLHLLISNACYLNCVIIELLLKEHIQNANTRKKKKSSRDPAESCVEWHKHSLFIKGDSWRFFSSTLDNFKCHNLIIILIYIVFLIA